MEMTYREVRYGLASKIWAAGRTMQLLLFDKLYNLHVGEEDISISDHQRSNSTETWWSSR